MPFHYTRRVQFCDTDMVGIVHFSMYFRYIEEAEHALWRAAGVPVIQGTDEAGWPRVAATFDFRNPLRFDDEVEIAVEIAAVTRRTIRYAFTLTMLGTPIGAGSLTAVRARKDNGRLQALDVPADIVRRLRAVTGEPAPGPGLPAAS